MALTKITVVPYLQSWSFADRKLRVRLLVAPAGNPLEPLLGSPAGVARFAEAKLAFKVSISDSVAALPQRTLVDQTIKFIEIGQKEFTTPKFVVQDPIL